MLDSTLGTTLGKFTGREAVWENVELPAAGLMPAVMTLIT